MGFSSTPAAAAAAAPSRRKVALYLALLTLQYGAQPLISKRFVRQDTIVTSLVLATEAAKVICAIILLIAEGSLKKQFSNWTLTGSLTASGLPAAIYALQNSLLQVSYKNLDSLTFSILNQTKLLWTAFFTFLILGQKQSSRQILALALLIGAAVLLSVGESSSKGSKGGGSDYILLYGIIPVTVASMLSGLASSLCQWASQVKKHTSYMMTIEMSFIGSMCLLASTYRSPDGEAIRKYGFFHEWTFWTVLCEAVKSFGFCTALACMLYIPDPMGRFRWFLSLGEDIPGPTSVHPRHWFTLTEHFFMADWEVIFPNCLLQSTATMLSDHCLLLLGLHDNPSMKRWFHLESFWTDLDGFIDAVKTSWEQPAYSLCLVERPSNSSA